jgi:hypothetical protein
LAYSHTPNVNGIILKTFLPKNENPIVSQNAMIFDPHGLIPFIINVNTVIKPTIETFSNAAPIPPTAT